MIRGIRTRHLTGFLEKYADRRVGVNASRETRFPSIGGGEVHEHLARRGGRGYARGEEENEKPSHDRSVSQAGKMTNCRR